MTRRNLFKLNTDYMFNGCSNLDASELSFHSISPLISSMRYMFYGAGLPYSTCMDNENIKFDNLVSCENAFTNAGFSFYGTKMQFFGNCQTNGNSTTWVSSINGFFKNNQYIATSAPTILLSKSNGLTSDAAILSALDNRFITPSGDDESGNDIYSSYTSSKGIYDFSYLYANTSISSVEMRGICNSLAASSVLWNNYTVDGLSSVYISSITPTSIIGDWNISEEGYGDYNSLICYDIPEAYRDQCVSLYNAYAIREFIDDSGTYSDYHIRKFIKLNYGFETGDFIVSFKYKLDKGSETIGFSHTNLRICNGVENEGSENERFCYQKFSVNGNNGIVTECEYFNGNIASTPDENGWYSISYHCAIPSDVRIVLWNSSPSFFENILISNLTIIGKNVTVVADDFVESTDLTKGKFRLYREYTSKNIGKIDFSHMFDNCGNLTTYSGFIPQFGSTYESMFNNCSSLKLDLSTMFKNYYLSGESTSEYYISSISVSYDEVFGIEDCESHCWNLDPLRKFNGFNSMHFYDNTPPSYGSYHNIHSYFAIVDKYGAPLRFNEHERIRISYSFLDDIRMGSIYDRPLGVSWFVGDRHGYGEPWLFGNRPNFYSSISYRGGWMHNTGEFRAGPCSDFGGALIFGIRGEFHPSNNFWFGNIAIDSDRHHIRISDFSPKQETTTKSYSFEYGTEQSRPQYVTAYNTNTCLEGYCMSSIAYMFNNCGKLYASDDNFDIVSIVRRTAETLEYLGYDPASKSECFIGAFPNICLGMKEPLENLTTVTYDLNNISQKYDIIRYCSYTEDDSDKYGIGTSYMKWAFSSGFLRYGGIFIDNPNYFFVIPYYRVENENGDLIDLTPHVSDKETTLTPEGFSGAYRRSAHFLNHDDWVMNSTNPFKGGETIPCQQHITYNWVKRPNILYGALIYDLDGNFIKKAYVGEWSEYVYMNGFHGGCFGVYEVTAHKEHTVSIYNGTPNVDIPDVGTVKMEVSNLTEERKSVMLSNECLIDTFSGITYAWRNLCIHPQILYRNPIVASIYSKVYKKQIVASEYPKVEASATSKTSNTLSNWLSLVASGRV